MITLNDILEAEKRIRDYASHTLFKRSTYLSERLGFNLHLKFENMQQTGSFKIRGAANKFLSMREALTRSGVVAASAGNHAQGVAKMATMLGIKSTIVMPEPTPIVKVQSTKAYGAEVVLHGETFDEAFAHAKGIEKDRGMAFVHPFDDPLIMAGQGTVGLEMLQDVPELDYVLVPIGGGGLMGGIATVIRARSPKTKIIGVQTVRSPNVGRKVMNPKLTELSPSEPTFAEGIAVKMPSQKVVEYLHTLVDDVVFVSDEEIAETLLVLLEKVKTVTEGAGAAALAAIMSRKVQPAPDTTVGVVLSGGNVDVRLLGSIIDRGLSTAGRMMGLRVLTDDRPGALLQICDVIAREKGNIFQIYHYRNSPMIRFGQTEIELHVETRGADHRDAVIKSLEKAGYHVKRLF